MFQSSFATNSKTGASTKLVEGACSAFTKPEAENTQRTKSAICYILSPHFPSICMHNHGDFINEPTHKKAAQSSIFRRGHESHRMLLSLFWSKMNNKARRSKLPVEKPQNSHEIPIFGVIWMSTNQSWGQDTKIRGKTNESWAKNISGTGTNANLVKGPLRAKKRHGTVVPCPKLFR